LGTLEHPIERASHVMTKWDRTLAQRPGYALMQVANAARPKWGDRLVQFRMESSRYFFDGEMIGDWFGPARYRQMWDESSGKLIPAAEMRKLLERFDSRLLALNLDGAELNWEDYNREFETLDRHGDQALLGLRDKP